jgi:hypothetical protein
MDRRIRARDLVAHALAEVERELTAPRYRLCPEHLGTCKATLEGYLAGIDRDELPPRREREEALGRLVHDAWPYDVPLGTVIRQAERAWRTC